MCESHAHHYFGGLNACFERVHYRDAQLCLKFLRGELHRHHGHAHGHDDLGVVLIDQVATGFNKSLAHGVAALGALRKRDFYAANSDDGIRDSPGMHLLAHERNALLFIRNHAKPVAQLRAQVQNERFQIVTSIRGLPLGVRSGLQTLFGSPDLDIAEPGAEFQVGGSVVNRNLPTRRMAVAGCSYERCLVYYERGGSVRTWRVVMFHWTPDATRLEWGGAAPGGLATIEDLRRVVLSGASKGAERLW